MITKLDCTMAHHVNTMIFLAGDLHRQPNEINVSLLAASFPPLSLSTSRPENIHQRPGPAILNTNLLFFKLQ